MIIGILLDGKNRWRIKNEFFYNKEKNLYLQIWSSSSQVKLNNKLHKGFTIQMKTS